VITSAHRLGEPELRAEVCVIGSGGGGSVVAAELAEAGRDVVVVEQGGHHGARDFDQREDHMLPLLFEDSAMRMTEDSAYMILQGRGVGGSSVIDLCTCLRAPEPVLALWRDEHGVRELESLDASFERVERALQVRPIEEAELNPLNRAIRRGCELLGYHGLVAQHNRVDCVGSGFCLLGCSYDAKQSMLLTYIPRADRAGARIVADCRAERIEGRSGDWRVRASAVDPGGRPKAEVRVACDVVVCAAGAIATPLLLQASDLGNEQVGRNLHLQPSLIASGLFAEPMHSYYGIPQAWYVDEFIKLERDAHSGYALMPIAGFPVLTAASLPGFGPELFESLREHARFGGLMALLHDRSSGTVEADSDGRPRIRYALDGGDRKQLTKALKHAVEVLWASGASRVVVPYLDGAAWLAPEDGASEIDRRGVAEGILPLTSTDPQSTCRMGEDPKRSVVNSFGELHGEKGVFVADSSLFPTSLGAPPQLTTSALADRVARHVAARWPELKGSRP
jgi:choline dehydrogenase-like flavoprotein